MITKGSMTPVEFDNVVTANDWKKFDQVFFDKNDDKVNLSYELNYDLNPDGGDVYFVQFNGVVRAMICIRSLNTISASGGSITFDYIIEGKESQASSSSAKYIQPEEPKL
jgi:hypothetical protein